MHWTERSVIRVATRWTAAAPSPGRITKAGLHRQTWWWSRCRWCMRPAKRPAGGEEGGGHSNMQRARRQSFVRAVDTNCPACGTQNSWYQTAMWLWDTATASEREGVQGASNKKVSQKTAWSHFLKASARRGTRKNQQRAAESRP